MAIVRLALENPGADTDTLLYTSDRQSIASVIATNKSSTPATIRVWLVPSGATIPAEYSYLSYDTVVPGNNSLETFRVAIESADEVYVRASTADISFSLNGVYESSGNYNKVTIQTNAPSVPTIGDVWINDFEQIKFWDGSSWVDAVPGSAGYAQISEPSIPQEGQIWVDLDGVPLTEPDYPTVTYTPTQPTGLDATNTGNIWVNANSKTVNVWDGTQWIYTNAVASYTSVSPPSPATGQIWIDSATDLMYFYDGSSWVLGSPPGSSYQSSAPSSPMAGQLWVDSDDNFIYVWSGSAWIQAGGGGFDDSQAILASRMFG